MTKEQKIRILIDWIIQMDEHAMDQIIQEFITDTDTDIEADDREMINEDCESPPIDGSLR